jgi:hypothetical protein
MISEVSVYSHLTPSLCIYDGEHMAEQNCSSHSSQEREEGRGWPEPYWSCEGNVLNY